MPSWRTWILRVSRTGTYVALCLCSRIYRSEERLGSQTMRVSRRSLNVKKGLSLMIRRVLLGYQQHHPSLELWLETGYERDSCLKKSWKLKWSICLIVVERVINFMISRWPLTAQNGSIAASKMKPTWCSLIRSHLTISHSPGWSKKRNRNDSWTVMIVLKLSGAKRIKV